MADSWDDIFKNVYGGGHAESLQNEFLELKTRFFVFSQIFSQHFLVDKHKISDQLLKKKNSSSQSTPNQKYVILRITFLREKKWDDFLKKSLKKKKN